MKKYFVLLASGLLLLTLAACGEDTPTEPTHTHNYATTMTAPTCTEKGYTTYSCACGDSYTADEVAANGHTWVSPTCTVAQTCSVCQATEGEANGHTWADATCTEAKTCSICQATEGEANGHTWADATCTEAKTCSVCQVTEGTPNGHTWIDATCTVAKTCTTCGVTEGAALGHSWKEATCLAPRTCSACDKTEGELGAHQYQETARVKATITEDGSASYTCSLCGDSYQEVLYATGSIGLAYKRNNYGTYTVAGLGTCTDSHVIIPRYYEGVKVTAIDNKAFYECTTITEITIPDTIDKFGEQIFDNCSALHTVYCNTPYYSSNKFLNTSSIKKVVFGGQSMPDFVVNNCANIEEIVIEDSVTSVGRNALYFSGCSSLRSITIGNGVTGSIGYGAFSGCSSLESITIGNGVTSINGGAFDGCSSLRSITIGNGVTSIVSWTFDDCSNLESITIGNGVTCIEDLTFSEHSSLTSITIGNGVTSIGYGAFSHCSSLTSITIPDSVTRIGDYAFAVCKSLKSITIGNGVTSIGFHAFASCSGLTSITIPDSVYSIRNSAFSACSNLTSITIPDSVTSIGDMAFSDCSRLTDIHFGGTKDQWRAIDKGDYWNSRTGNYIVHCTDGDVSKED